MKFLRKIMVSVVLLQGMFTSCDFLDVSDLFEDTLQYDSIFTSARNIEAYLWGIASQFPNEGLISQYPKTPGPMATDVMFCTYGTTGQFYGLAFALGEHTEDGGTSMDNWGSMYKIIRRCNLLLSRIDEVTDLTNLKRYEIIGYARMMRAYAYYNLVRNYGPLIIIEDVMNSNEDMEYYNRSRATYDETIDYICSEMEAAAAYMPETVNNSLFGRPTKGAAYALVAQLRLMQASPLFNGGTSAKTAFGSWTRSTDGAHYVSQEYDEKRWAVAAAAAKRVIDMGLYSLHTVARTDDTPELPATISDANFPYGAGDIDPFRSYSEMFTGETVPTKNPEYIWAVNSNGADGTIQSIIRHCLPYYLDGWNGLSLTQKMVDAYRMNDGRTIEEASADGYYSESGYMTGDSVFSGYTLKGGVFNMYYRREPRFYASVGFCERLWPGTSTSQSLYNNHQAAYYYGEIDGKYGSSHNSEDFPPTGYVLTKYVHEEDNRNGTGASVNQKTFSIIRYAEILLIYAEALNNLNQSYTIQLPYDTDTRDYTVSRDINEIKSAFDQIRYRSGMPGLTTAEVSNSETMQELIERERMVEFLYENKRYFDVRRWGIYEESENTTMVGMNMEASGKDLFYQRTPVNHKYVRNRLVDKKLLFMPIPRTEIRRASDLDQNPGWGS